MTPEQAIETLERGLFPSPGRAADAMREALTVLADALAERERAVEDARFMLTPLSHYDTAHDAWQLDRARWHWHYGDRALAQKEFADIQAMRRSNLWSHPEQEDKYRLYPDDALEQPIRRAAPGSVAPAKDRGAMSEGDAIEAHLWGPERMRHDPEPYA